MITLFDTMGSGSCMARREGLGQLDDATVWIDMLNPTDAEEAQVEAALKIDVPTRAEMREIEASNRFYNENGTQFMTAFVVHANPAGDTQSVLSSNVTFILHANRLITVRYGEPRAFSIFADRACKGAATCTNGATIMIGLIETLIQRQADLIERLQDSIEMLAPKIFRQNGTANTVSPKLEQLLQTIGRQGDVTSRMTESATSIHRTLLYFTEAVRALGEHQKLLTRIESADRDIVSLGEHLRFVSGRTSFLLDATLGMISTEQNQIIKLFSVMAVMLMPPTLVASIYGMNFKHMPELDWPCGYPLAVILMFFSGLLPFLYFRRRGWL